MDETPAIDVAKLVIEKYPVEEWVFVTDAPGWISHWEWNVVRAYARMLCNQLELRDWTIRILHDPSAEGDDPDTMPMATVKCLYGRKMAEIKLCRGWEQRDPEEKRVTLVHELTHLHCDGMADIVHTDLHSYLGDAVWNVVWAGFRRHLEHAVDAMAEALAKHMPVYPIQTAPQPSQPPTTPV